MATEEVEKVYGLDHNDVQAALLKVPAMASYQAFCANANPNSLDAAFGR